MQPGAVVADRFELEALAGRGGMGSVYRAIDRASGARVALKLLHGGGRESARFVREAELLAAVRHPAIVRYLGHGTTATGEPWLAMAWLDGEDLASRLATRGLTVAETLALARRVAGALAVAHGHRPAIVHRDLKPSNLFLVGGEAAEAQLLDFGVARLAERVQAMTRTGALVGTPAYMAPEQARGAREVGPAADVFALGCLLYECLVGRPPFVGEHAMAVLAKILLEEAPPLRAQRPDLPASLGALVDAMLAKEVAQRPADGSAVLEALDALEPLESATTMPPPRPRAEALTASEQRVVSVLLAGRLSTDGAGRADDGDTVAPGAEDTAVDAAATLPSSTGTGAAPGDALATLADVARAHGGRAERLLDGSSLLVVSAEGAATDQAARAARAALALRRRLPTARMALATGRALLAEGGRLPVGEVIDRAARLLDEAGAGAGVVVDDTTHGLLDARFRVVAPAGATEGPRRLVGEREPFESTRVLLGVATPCVGRARELDLLERLFDECVAEPRAAVALVVAPAGAGKSRLRQELARRLHARGPVELWLGRADALAAGSSFSLHAPGLRRLAGVRDGEPAADAFARLRARVQRHLPAESRERVAAFLGELASVPRVTDGDEADDAVARELRAARRDPTLLGDQIRRAWEDFVAAEAAARPVVLLLEDLHWGDWPSLRLVDAALRHAADRPLLVVGFARPDVDERFPRLWAEHDVQTLRLRPLSRRASSELARAVLGDAPSDDTIGRLVDRAAGNALYLEELVRAEAAGHGDALPPTVLAMVQARLERLDPDARRLLRAASIFGDTFWSSGVRALLGGTDRTAPLRELVEELVEEELIAPRPSSRFPDERELTFRHALVREAAYAMLTDGDRALGHRLAGAWLAERGERDARTLAEHFERGGDAARALPCYVAAVEESLAGNDFSQVLALCARAIALGARDEGERTSADDRASIGRLHALAAEAHRWRGEFADAARAADAALALLVDGTAPFYRAAAERVTACGSLADGDGALAIAARLAASAPESDAAGAVRLIALAAVVVQLNHLGRYARAEELLGQLRRDATPTLLADPAVAGWIGRAATMRAASEATPGPLLVAAAASAAQFVAAGDLRMACYQQMNLGYARFVVGQFALAEEALVAARATAERMGLAHVALSVTGYLGWARAHLDGRLAEGTADLEAALAALSEKRMKVRIACYLARVRARGGDAAGAERDAAAAVALAEGLPTAQALARATWAWIVVTSDARRADAALAAAADALTTLGARGSVEDGEPLLRLAHAEALAALGRTGEARAAAAAARDLLLRRAEGILDETTRRSYLDAVPENARTLALAAALDV